LVVEPKDDHTDRASLSAIEPTEVEVEREQDSARTLGKRDDAIVIERAEAKGCEIHHVQAERRREESGGLGGEIRVEQKRCHAGWGTDSIDSPGRC